MNIFFWGLSLLSGYLISNFFKTDKRIPYINQQIKNNLKQKTRIYPRQIVYGKVRTEGFPISMLACKIIDDPEKTFETYNYLYVIYAFASHPIKKFVKIWIGKDTLINLEGENENALFDERIVYKYSKNLFFTFSTGKETQKGKTKYKIFAYNSIGIPEKEKKNIWYILGGERSKLKNIAFVGIFLEYEKWKGKIPKVEALILGKKVTYSGKFSNNPAACLKDYLKNIIHLPYRPSVFLKEKTEIERCEEKEKFVDKKKEIEFTEAKYISNCVIYMNEDPISIIKKFLSSMNGYLIWRDMGWIIYVEKGKKETILPENILKEEDCLEKIVLNIESSNRNKINQIKVFYQGETFSKTEQLTISHKKLIEEDGKVLTSTLYLPYVNSFARAERIGKLELIKARHNTIIKVKVHIRVKFFFTISKIVFIDFKNEKKFNNNLFMVINTIDNIDGTADIILKETCPEASIKTPDGNINKLNINKREDFFREEDWLIEDEKNFY